jgi:hypothetical protein
MSDIIREAYAGYDELVSYLRDYRNKSFRGFLFCCREIIVESAFFVEVASWQDLDNNWYDHFLTEANELLEQETFVTLKKKVRFLFCIERVTPSRARFDSGELLGMTTW